MNHTGTEEVLLNVSVDVEKEVEVKMDAHRTLSHKVNGNQLLACTLDTVNKVVNVTDLESAAGTDFFLLFVETENPESSFYSTSVSNSSMLDRIAYPQAEYKGIVKQIDTDKGVNYEFIDTLVHDARGIEVTLKGVTYTKPVVFSVKEEYLATQFSFTHLNIWEPSYATSSQTRVGELVAKRLDVSYKDYFERIGFNIQAFEEEKDGRVRIKDINKMSKRVKQTASSSVPRDFFKGFKLEEVHDVDFESVEGNDTARHLLFSKDGKSDAAEILIIPGFFVKQEIKSVVPVFNNDSLSMSHKEVSITKDAMDGSHLIDRDFAYKHGLADKDGNIRAGEQFRWGQAIKGLLIVYEGLKEKLGVDIVLADGGIKGDAIVGFEQGDMPFSVLKRVREDTLNPTINVSRQVTTYNQNEGLIAGLESDTKDLISKVLSYDDQAIRDFLNIKEYDVADEEEINVDQLTTRLYSTGKSIFMKSHTLKKKLADLLKSSLQKFSNGSSLYLKEASFKHMAVDPYAIVHYLSEGVLGVDATTISDMDKVGIAPHHAVTSKRVIADDKEVFVMDKSKGFAFRFPFLHKNEGRILNEDEDLFIDLDTKEFYERYVSKGYNQGILFYSLWDMEPEGQSGADFDGDESGYTTNKNVVENIEKQPLFLDYSVVDDKLVSGCPFTNTNHDLMSFLNQQDKDYIESHDIVIENGGISAPADCSGTEEWINLVGKLGAYLARHTLEGNEIGRFTNISLSIVQIISELNNKMIEIDSIQFNGKDSIIESIQEEITGYENLVYFLSVAIRWEVDKAKHGGAYLAKMPFLYAFLDKPELKDVIGLEKKYNISLQRFLFGAKLV